MKFPPTFPTSSDTDSVTVYTKGDSLLYYVDDTGTEFQIQISAGGLGTIIPIPDDTDPAFMVHQGADSYIKCITTNGAEFLNLGNSGVPNLIVHVEGNLFETDVNAFDLIADNGDCTISSGLGGGSLTMKFFELQVGTATSGDISVGNAGDRNIEIGGAAIGAASANHVKIASAYGSLNIGNTWSGVKLELGSSSTLLELSHDGGEDILKYDSGTATITVGETGGAQVTTIASPQTNTSDLDVTGNITISGTVDGVDISTYALTSLGDGCSQLGVHDAAAHWVGADVEAVLAEIGVAFTASHSNSFTRFLVAAGPVPYDLNPVVATSPTDTLTLVAGTNMTIETDSVTDTVKISATGLVTTLASALAAGDTTAGNNIEVSVAGDSINFVDDAWATFGTSSPKAGIVYATAPFDTFYVGLSQPFTSGTFVGYAAGTTPIQIIVGTDSIQTTSVGAGSDSGLVRLASGDTQAVALATGGDSGRAEVVSGQTSLGAGIAGGRSGTVLVQSGHTEDAPTGRVILETGTTQSGGTGSLSVRTGRVQLAGGSASGLIDINTGAVVSAAGNSGDLRATTGASATTDTGDITFDTGDATVGSSGQLTLTSGACGTAGSERTGRLTLTTGSANVASAARTGSIGLFTGAADSGDSGGISLRTGPSSSGTQGDVRIDGHNIDLNPNASGAVTVSGKLTVTGLIDPTGLILTHEDTASVPTIATEGALFVSDGSGGLAVDHLIYKDGTGATLDLSTAGSAGDVVGPGSSHSGVVARYDGVTGKLIKDSPNGPYIADDGTIILAGTHAIQGLGAGSATIALQTSPDAGTTGGITIESGDSSGANSGSIFLHVGAASGTQGSINLEAPVVKLEGDLELPDAASGFGKIYQSSTPEDKIEYVAAGKLEISISDGGPGSSGRFIQIDGTTVPPQLNLGPPADTADLKLGGTAGFVFVENTTGHIGISNATPIVPLDVTGDTNITGDAEVTGLTTTATLKVTTTPTLNHVLTSDASGNATWQAGSGMSSFLFGGDVLGDRTINDGDTLTVAGGTGITTTMSNPDTATFDLDDTAVAPGIYTNADITVDQQGRLTAAASGSSGGTMSSFTVGGDTGTRVITDGNTLQLTGGDGITTWMVNPDTATFDVDLLTNGGITLNGTSLQVKLDDSTLSGRLDEGNIDGSAGSAGDVLTTNGNANGTTWAAPAGGGGEDLAATLLLGNETGGRNIIVENADELLFEKTTGPTYARMQGFSDAITTGISIVGGDLRMKGSLSLFLGGNDLTRSHAEMKYDTSANRVRLTTPFAIPAMTVGNTTAEWLMATGSSTNDGGAGTQVDSGDITIETGVTDQLAGANSGRTGDILLRTGLTQATGPGGAAGNVTGSIDLETGMGAVDQRGYVRINASGIVPPVLIVNNPIPVVPAMYVIELPAITLNGVVAQQVSVVWSPRDEVMIYDVHVQNTASAAGGAQVPNTSPVAPFDNSADIQLWRGGVFGDPILIPPAGIGGPSALNSNGNATGFDVSTFGGLIFNGCVIAASGGRGHIVFGAVNDAARCEGINPAFSQIDGTSGQQVEIVFCTGTGSGIHGPWKVFIYCYIVQQESLP
jgi:hypothetical protein